MLSPLRPARYQSPEATAFLRLYGLYLGEQLEVWCASRQRYGLLVGLPAPAVGEAPFADVLLYATAAEPKEELFLDFSTAISNLKPCLYGFEDLASEIVLPDGRRVVPAVEVAKLGGGHENIDDAKLSKDTFGNSIIALTAYGKHCWACYEHDFTTTGIGYNFARINWLRAAHFAVGLRPEQYHRKAVASPCAAGCAGCDKGKEVGRG
jgi:hypothetical protein